MILNISYTKSIKYTPVSYTHLVIGKLFRPMDTVYTVKADEGGRAASAEELASLIGNQAEAMNSLASAYEAAVTGADADSVISVSYTHLDVYKRQVMGSCLKN